MELTPELREELIGLLMNYQDDFLRKLPKDHPDIERCQNALNILCENDSPSTECTHTEEEPGMHWAETRHGEEYRIDCGCPCEECRDY
jgi:hypothetical protein